MKLFVIGNGFDITHGIPCKFSDFYMYLKRFRYDVLDYMEKYYDIEENSKLWSDFENALESNIVYDSLKEIINDYPPNLTSNHCDWFEAETYVEQECQELLDYIRIGFEEWINFLEISSVDKKFTLDSNDLFMTFNYTETLENVYGIAEKNILHIHNKVGGKLIFGHGKETEKFNVKSALYGNENIFEMVDEYGNVESSEVGHEKFAEIEVIKFYNKMRKPTEEVIDDNQLFFSNISEIKEVIVWGLSYSDIDFPYIKKISKSINNNIKWTLSYFSESDRDQAINTMQRLGISESLYLPKHFVALEKELKYN
ncbi:bacteriophage abortive infection AbiH family protein [Chryseobacterium sp. PBS4-4]|uniref:Bacteriophage abortive infection AbiH family protein n=1 Tax=Chryseobacterium edaphi TaxID=2976532 RepID=A0ABT2W8D0_9FLAO|nr:bacteriophage abortive infection AbiH family protein [Chryseobacterium edaphi]MCU7618472.1 bacteriophage abortive infection AbiH family protein [Chryseobacterium edaphi]